MAITHKQAAQEKMLYCLYLDLYYSDCGLDDRIEELTDDLKHAKAMSKKTKKSLAQVEKQYFELNGRKPMAPK